MQRTGTCVLLIVLGFVAGPALADEVVYFTNGTSMPVRSHTIEGETITVDLGDGEMAFPVSMVDRVETDDGIVVRGDGAVANKQVVRTDAGRATGIAPSRHARGSWASPRVIAKESRADAARTGRAASGDRRIPTRQGVSAASALSRRRTTSGAPVGTAASGTKRTIPGKTQTQRRRTGASLTERKR